MAEICLQTAKTVGLESFPILSLLRKSVEDNMRNFRRKSTSLLPSFSVKPKPEAHTPHRLLHRHRPRRHPCGAKRGRWTPESWEVSCDQHGEVVSLAMPLLSTWIWMVLYNSRACRFLPPGAIDTKAEPNGDLHFSKSDEKSGFQWVSDGIEWTTKACVSLPSPQPSEGEGVLWSLGQVHDLCARPQREIPSIRRREESA